MLFQLVCLRRNNTFIHLGVCLGVLTVGILAILLAILMLRHRSNKGTVADFKDPPKHR